MTDAARPTFPGTMPNAYQPGKGNLPPEDEALVARRQKALGPAYRLFYETPLHLVRGQGVWLYDADGKAVHSISKSNTGCINCHNDSGNRDFVMFFDRFP